MIAIFVVIGVVIHLIAPRWSAAAVVLASTWT